ncbi:MAG: class I SAM-dependent methyltransferase [Acidimicrobiales bacterium]
MTAAVTPEPLLPTDSLLPPDDNVPSDEFHSILHTLRTAELRCVPKGARRVVSVGASGRWYFDWFEDCVGPLELHIGVEAFEEKPVDLPANVEWVASTADDFTSIADDSVDLVFAGQTTEHLWPDELVGFLSESARVLRPEGLLVVDSPNRLVTQALHWSHGGHTIELSADEMTELLDLAGFRVETCTGLWRCRYGDTIRSLEDGVRSRADVADRSSGGVRAPDDSFVWWINARRKPDATVDRRALLERTRQFFAALWDERVTRGMTAWPQPQVAVAAGEQVEIGSLPFLLGVRSWDLELEILPSHRSLDSLTVAVTAPGTVIHQLDRGAAEVVSDTTLRWRFDQPWLSFATGIVVRAHAATPSTIELPVRLRPVDGW